MNQPQIDTDVSVSRDVETVETIVKTFWDIARAATELIGQLREEKKGLLNRVNDLQHEIRSVRSTLVEREEELKRLHAEQAQFMNANGREFFSGEERENFKIRVRDLLAKINSHL